MAHEYHTRRRVEFSDTDMAGIVHFARFFIFMQTAEHEFLRSLFGGPFIEVDGQRLGWPRLSASCEYLRPARYEDLLDIHLRVTQKGPKTLSYRFDIVRDGQLIAKGMLTSACAVKDPVQGYRAIPIPSIIADKITF